MFFILSKLLYFLLIPFNWVLLLLIGYIITKSPARKRILKIWIIIIIVLFTNPWLYKTANKVWQAEYKELATNKNYEIGILLTGMVQFDRKDQGFFGAAADRFIQTATLYHTKKIKKVLVTGGSGSLLHDSPAEALYLKEMLIKNGVAEKDIITEPLSRNTYENAVFSKRILDSLQVNTTSLLITSALHMKRSEAVFKKARVDFEIYATDFKVVDERFAIDDTMIPDVKLLKDWSHLLKEMIGLWVYQLTGKA